MDMRHATFMKWSNNGRHSNDGSNDRTYSMESKEDNAGVDMPTVTRVGDQTGKNRHAAVYT